MAQQVARRDRADDLALGAGDAEMAESQPLDAADGTVEERVLGDGLQRRLHDRHRGGRTTPPRRRVDRAQHIALGDDAGHARSRAYEHAAHPFLDQLAHGLAHGRLRRGEDGRGAHDIANAVAVGEAVEARQRTRFVGRTG